MLHLGYLLTSGGWGGAPKKRGGVRGSKKKKKKKEGANREFCYRAVCELQMRLWDGIFSSLIQSLMSLTMTQLLEVMRAGNDEVVEIF